MSDAPERIWTTGVATVVRDPMRWYGSNRDELVEYVRADLLAEAQAHIEALRNQNRTLRAVNERLNPDGMKVKLQ